MTVEEVKKMWKELSPEWREQITEIVLEEQTLKSIPLPSHLESYWKNLLDLIETQNKKLEKIAGKM